MRLYLIRLLHNRWGIEKRHQARIAHFLFCLVRNYSNCLWHSAIALHWCVLEFAEPEISFLMNVSKVLQISCLKEYYRKWYIARLRGYKIEKNRNFIFFSLYSFIKNNIMCHWILNISCVLTLSFHREPRNGDH